MSVGDLHIEERDEAEALPCRKFQEKSEYNTFQPPYSSQLQGDGGTVGAQCYKVQHDSCVTCDLSKCVKAKLVFLIMSMPIGLGEFDWHNLRLCW